MGYMIHICQLHSKEMIFPNWDEPPPNKTNQQQQKKKPTTTTSSKKTGQTTIFNQIVVILTAAHSLKLVLENTANTHTQLLMSLTELSSWEATSSKTALPFIFIMRSSIVLASLNFQQPFTFTNKYLGMFSSKCTGLDLS